MVLLLTIVISFIFHDSNQGAGKTTTISMLTGAIAPSSGYATVEGKDIRTDLAAIRQDIGICLQVKAACLHGNTLVTLFAHCSHSFSRVFCLFPPA
jgi:ABC-type multidrug transport system ATPase subunit